MAQRKTSPHPERHAARHRRPRPSRTGWLRVQISPALIDLAHQRAHREGVTLAEVVENALRGYLR